MKNACFFVGLLFIFFGCERDNPESKDNFPIVFDHLNPNLVVEVIDTTIEFINPGTYYDFCGEFEYFLDIDSDGSNDIVFTHSLIVGKWGVQHDLSDLLVIGSSFEVSADVRDDTVFVCEYVDSTEYSDRLFFEMTL